jgi:hypothetical protein
MKRSLFFGFLFVVILMVLVSACSSGGSTPTTPANLTSAQVKAMIDEKCSVCHSVQIVYDANYSQSQWSSIFDRMIGQGAKVSTEEKAVMIDWLVTNQ